MTEETQQPDPSDTPLRVCIDARLIGNGAVGGVEQFIIGLARGLSQLADETIEYSFLVYANNDEWLRPYIGSSCRLIHAFGATRLPGWSQALRRVPFVRAASYRLLSPIRQLKQKHGRVVLAPPQSDGFVEREGFHIIHFPTQNAFLTKLPSIYHPWDLQHLHLPQYFTPAVIQKRECEYRAFCAQAAMVVAATSWQKQDLIEQYQLPEGKVEVIAPAPVVEFYPLPTLPQLEQVRDKLSLPPQFFFYPAQTWPHKNHLGLFRALALVRDREGVKIPLVSSGKRNDYFPTLEKVIAELDLADQVRFLDYVSPLELQCLYKLCRGMVFPSLFEGYGMPISEAFVMGAPTACSNVTSLPEQAGDAALIFDPQDTEDMVQALFRLWRDDALREDLAERARKRAGRLRWERTASIFRAHYRRLAGRRLAPEDQSLVSTSLSTCTTT